MGHSAALELSDRPQHRRSFYSRGSSAPRFRGKCQIGRGSGRGFPFGLRLGGEEMVRRTLAVWKRGGT